MISVILSIHNEADTISELVKRIDKVMSGYRGVEWECLGIDDASTDTSWAVLNETSASHPKLKPIKHPERLGQKGCFMTGIEVTSANIIVLMDADLQVLPEELPKVLDPILDEGFEWVCTYNQTTHGGRPRSIISGIGNMFMKMFFATPVKDAGNNFVAFKKSYLKGVRLTENDQRYLLPIAMSRGLRRDRITEVPVLFEKRKFGRSKYSMLRKTLLGVPEMLRLKYRILTGFYEKKSS